MVSLRIDIQKKDLWLVSAIFVFIVGAGVVVAYNNNMNVGTPDEMGHSAGEIDVYFNGTLRSLQGALNVIDSGGQFGGGGMSFGDWESTDSGQQTCNGGSCTGAALIDNVVYQAETDGIVISYVNSGFDRWVLGFTDGVDATTRVVGANMNGYNHVASITMPVKKGDYWNVSTNGGVNVLWMPIVSGGGSGGGSYVSPWTFFGSDILGDTINHNLGTTNIIVHIFGANNTAGTDMFISGDTSTHQNQPDYAVGVRDITTNSFKIYAGGGLLKPNTGGDVEKFTNGYYKVVVIAV